MSNSYTKAAFDLTVTVAEAGMLRRVIAAVELIDDTEAGSDVREARYASLRPDFAALFPRGDEDPFAGLLDLFEDPQYPYLDFHVAFSEADQLGQVLVTFSGEQFGIDVAAKLIQRCARSALPFGFEWASDCDRLRVGEFGGGYVVITEHRVSYGHTTQLLDRAIARARDEGADGFVLAIRDPQHGLSFWNDDAGFDRLSRARVFSEAEAANHDVPLAHDQREWLAMPEPLRL
ncbi:hypothetical protein BSL82_13465 [Tardibacter chloracetimidivorans]|uniref:Uncharacterized protein n=1 Tax=Tardibacter chloracetimidivorans TaxID=1921510 RepID=A0A1L3ZX60_9SPHN|nr:hypothetical protein [Tardibacter chloracetimidivorans]API60179.1 hypothetical protein BSL82_13465 [Tardibacter chloracetimidivorans]